MHHLSSTAIVLHESALIFCDFAKMLVNIRLTFLWFPNCNPYAQPLYLLTQIVDPYLRLFRGVFPTIFGLDFSPIIAVISFEFVKEVLREIQF